jgi:hypothetical protein
LFAGDASNSNLTCLPISVVRIGLAYFDLPIALADFQAGLRVNRWSVKDTAIFQSKSREVIWTDNAVAY